MTGKAKQAQIDKRKFWSERLPLVSDLLDKCIKQASLKNDAALSRMLGVAPPVISKLRHGRLHPCASIVLRINWDIGMRISTIRTILDVPAEYRF